MTTIVAIQGNGFAVVANDSRFSAMDEGGFASQIMTARANSGKVTTNGRYLLGAAGDVRAINILHHSFTPTAPAPSLSGPKLDKFFTTKFIPELRKCFEEQGYARPETDSSSHLAEQNSTILVVANTTIYVVDTDYAWASDQNGVYALGTGSAYALGALKILMPKKAPSLTQAKQIALKAMAVAASYDPYTGPPFQTHVQERETKK